MGIKPVGEKETEYPNKDCPNNTSFGTVGGGDGVGDHEKGE